MVVGEFWYGWVIRSPELESGEDGQFAYDLRISGCEPNPVGTIHQKGEEFVILIRGNVEGTIGPQVVDVKPTLKEAQHSLERRFGVGDTL